MAVTPVKVLLFVAGGAAAAAATAYVSGAFDVWLAAPPPQVTALAPAPAGTPSVKEDRLPGGAPPAPSASGGGSAAGVPAQEQPASQPAAPAANAPAAPSFDIVRVETDGSMVVAGRAGPGAKVDVVAGSVVIGSAEASGAGDFAVVLDKPLAPGDYQISLRSTGPGEAVTSSTETAIVSVPQHPGGEVLAMIEEPGKPAELISVPQGSSQGTPAAASGPAGATAGQMPQTGSAEAPSSGSQPPVTSPSAVGAAAPRPEAQPALPAAGQSVVVEAVEIEGSMVFVAGSAEPGRRVRAYAGDILLGDAVTSPAGRFLVEAERDLPVGDYVIRVDALDADGSTVVARAAVPFEREPGEAIAAVAPAPGAPVAGSSPAVAPAAGVTAAPVAAPEEAPAVVALAPAGSPVPEAPAVGAGSDVGQPAAPAPDAAALDIEIATAPASTEQQPAEAQQMTAPKLQNVEGAVIIRRGDSLWRISRRVYGLGTRYSTIYLANQEQIRDPDLIWPGQVFKVPGKSKEGEDADMSKIGGQSTTVPGAETAGQ